MIRRLVLPVAGFPIRKSSDQSLLAAPRSLSQLSTSFIASDCLGIHRAPFVACPMPLRQALNFARFLEL